MRLAWLKKALAAGVLVACLVGSMYVTAPEEAARIPLGGAFKDVAAPIQGWVTAAGNGMAKALRTVFSFGHADEIEALKAQVSELEAEVNRLREVERENARLRGLLAYRIEQGGTGRMLPARVIGRDPGNWFAMIRINRGAADGVRRDMPVVLPAGLVGRTYVVGQHATDVLLITDPRSGVGGLVQETRTPGVVKGVFQGTSALRMSYLAKDAGIQKGQMVVTSGLGGLFPKGIPIGRISAVAREPSGLTKTADLVPAVDFEHLEEVLVVIEPPTVRG